MQTVKIECKVVMLPTEKKASYPAILKGVSGELSNHLKSHKDKVQHLYITSDEEIQEGDWVYDTKNKLILSIAYIKENRASVREYTNVTVSLSICKKIIASTDEELGYGDSAGAFYQLPHIFQSFINKYVKEYNKGNKIDKVLVEYDYIITNEDWSKRPVQLDGYCQLRTDKHNCISIHKVKDSWNREEVEELCRKAHSDGYDDCMTYAPDEYIEHLQERWIKENL